MFPTIQQHHIKNIQSLKDYECTVCYAFDPTIMRCSGPCKAPICLKCAADISKSSYHTRCPQRCSTPLKLEPIHSLKIEFMCPYNAEKCQEKIEGNQAFLEHSNNCQYITPESIQEDQKKEKFLCEYSHPLFFLDPELTLTKFKDLSLRTITRECAKCKQVRICRAYCKQCSSQQKYVAYCHDCRPIPCKKDKCPMGHQFEKIRVEDVNYDCDLCGFVIFNYSNFCYHDEKCNFGICGQCYQKLDKKGPIIHSKTKLEYFLAKKRNQDKLEEILNNCRYRGYQSSSQTHQKEQNNQQRSCLIFSLLKKIIK